MPKPEWDDAVAWRYMDLPKLASLLKDGLYMCRLDLLGDDECEGMMDHEQSVFFEGAVEAIEAFVHEIGRDPASLHVRASWDLYDAMRRRTYVSSWQLSEGEVWWMWKVYCGGKCGLALRSTYAKLDQLIPLRSPHFMDILIGQVRYDNSSPDPLALVTSKRAAFADERELRVLCDLAGAADASRGFFLGNTGEPLADSIVVSPLAPPWFRSVVEATCRSLGCFLPVEDSALRGIPPQPH